MCVVVLTAFRFKKKKPVVHTFSPPRIRSESAMSDDGTEVLSAYRLAGAADAGSFYAQTEEKKEKEYHATNINVDAMHQRWASCALLPLGASLQHRPRVSPACMLPAVSTVRKLSSPVRITVPERRQEVIAKGRGVRGVSMVAVPVIHEVMIIEGASSLKLDAADSPWHWNSGHRPCRGRWAALIHSCMHLCSSALCL